MAVERVVIRLMVITEQSILAEAEEVGEMVVAQLVESAVLAL